MNNLFKIFGVISLLLISGISIYILSTKWETGIDESTCKGITEEKEQGKCFYDLAVIKNDEVFCRKIKDSLEKENCHYGLAVKNDNLNICGRTGEKEESCFREILEKSENKGLCEETDIRSLQEKCYYHLAFVNDDSSLCSKSGDNEGKCKTELILKKQGDLIIYWSFDEGEGSVVNDSLRYGYQGTIYGAKWTKGVSGNALEFDGNNDYIQFTSPILSDPPYSICAWVKPDSVSDGMNHYIMANGGESGLSSGFYMNIEWGGNSRYQTGSYSFGVKKTNGNAGSVAYRFSSAEWVFLCGTWDGSVDSNHLNLYLNGNLVANGVLASWEGSSAQNLRIGSPTSRTDYTFDGVIDEVRIYNRILSNEEIRNLYLANAANAKKAEKYIKVISPNGGERWIKGKSYSIRWESSGIDTFKIRIINTVDASEFTQTITDNNRASLKTFGWTIPSSFAQGKNWDQDKYKIIVSEANATGSSYYWDMSDNYFSIVEDKCVDSDGGISYYVRGETSVKEGQFEDRCITSSITKKQDGLEEFYCLSENTLGHITVKCSNGCNNGECFGDLMVPQCIDQDGGEDIYINSGAFSEYGSGQGDCCVQSSGGSCVSAGSYLREGICKASSTIGELGFSEKIISCPNGCKNGACVE